MLISLLILANICFTSSAVECFSIMHQTFLLSQDAKKLWFAVIWRILSEVTLLWNIFHFSQYYVFFSLVGRCIKTWHLKQSKWESTEYSQTFLYLSHPALLLRMVMMNQHFFMSHLMLDSYIFRNVRIFYICCFLMFYMNCL